MHNMTNKIYELGIIPVVKLKDAKDAIPLAGALIKGGLSCAEITFRTDAAEESIKRISQQYPEMLVGAGTVLTVEQAKKAIDAGAKFLVSPGLNEELVKYCISQDILIYPGVSTPYEIEKALSLGLEVLKFFPAEPAGGLPMIKALCGPYTKVKFIPTGGINENNLNEYLSYDKIVACGGSWMVKDSLINEGKFDEITALVRTAVEKMHGFELKHIGINNSDSQKALVEAEKLSSLLGMPVKEGNSSVFTGTIFELMKSEYLGSHGHIGIGVNSVDRAYASLMNRGYEFREDTIAYDDKGKKTIAYLKDEFAGFAIHIVKK